jgi:uncharacterized protein
MQPEADVLRTVLTTAKTIAVVGLSADPSRPSYDVARYMQAQGYRVVPVNPNVANVLGEKSVACLQDIGFAVDIVNVFRKPHDVLPIAHDAIAIGAKCLWQQLGIANQQADALLRAHGIVSVMNRCMKVEHALLR